MVTSCVGRQRLERRENDDRTSHQYSSSTRNTQDLNAHHECRKGTEQGRGMGARDPAKLGKGEAGSTGTNAGVSFRGFPRSKQ